MNESGKVALITGAAAGLGHGIAIRLARAGYTIAFTYRPDGTPPDATADAIAAAGGRGFAVASDVALAGAGAACVAAAEARFGKVDVLVHAAGPIVVRRFERSTMSDYQAMIDGNLTSAVEFCAAALPGMRTRNFGRIVLFGMNGSQVTLPALGMSLYGAAKAAVTAFARTLALEEAARGITVNVIEPGDIRNKTATRAEAAEIAANNPTGHAGSWEDVADAVRFLVADESPFINGVCLSVSGGLVAVHE